MKNKPKPLDLRDMEKKIIECGCGRCRFYQHIKTPYFTTGICKLKNEIIGKYGCKVKFCDKFQLKEGFEWMEKKVVGKWVRE